jgi:hypothetical protein
VLGLALFPILLDQLGEIDRLLSHALHLAGLILASLAAEAPGRPAPSTGGTRSTISGLERQGRDPDQGHSNGRRMVGFHP